MLSLLPLLPFFISLTSQAPLEKRSSLGLAIDVNFPDPAFIKVDNRFYAFATNNGQQNVPVATSDDFSSWAVTGEDALPDLPSWSGGAIWAPDVVQLADGSFVMYMSALSLEDKSKHCVGMAKSTSVTGPYEPVDTPLACPLDQGGAIDPAGFQDTDGTQWVVYKVDGSSLGGGGQCGNGDGSHSTPIMLQQVSADDGITLIGGPQQILDRGEADGPLIEAPSLLRTAEGVYVLFFSSNCFNGNLYDTSYATSSNLHGPYEKSSAPLLVTGDEGDQLQSPGGLDVGPAGVNVVFHSDKEPGNAAVRQMWRGQIAIDGTTVKISA